MIRVAPNAILALTLAACATTTGQIAPDVGAPPLCAPGVALGTVAVSLSTRWRPDQKEPEERERLVRLAILDAFGELPCGRFIGLVPPATAVQTMVEITVREFGPILTLSVPVLWSLTAHVDYAITVRDVAQRTTRLRLAEQRQVGGPLVVQSMSAVRHTLATALREVIAGSKPPAGQDG